MYYVLRLISKQYDLGITGKQVQYKIQKNVQN